MFRTLHLLLVVVIGASIIPGCKVPALTTVQENRTTPTSFKENGDTTSSSLANWKMFFQDPYLVNLIDTALQRNQELKMTLQEVEIAKNDILFRRGALSPTVGARFGLGIEKVGRYTSQGAGDASTEIEAGKEVPDPLTDFNASLYASWEVDVWKKLHNAKQAAVTRYLSSVEGRSFVLTNLVAEVASSYYELLALDNQLKIIRQNIGLQNNALGVMKVQKQAARVTELAVQKFSAEILNSQGLEYQILQRIKETENKINFLLARYPQPIMRDTSNFFALSPSPIQTGVPSQLLANRPDIRQAELDLAAARLDVKVARAEFYPSFEITSAIGLQAFKPSYLVKYPESLLYSLAGDVAAPLINRRAIQAEFNSANARQLQAIYNYERSILNGYLEVSTQLSKMDNLNKSLELKSRQVDVLTRSVNISNDLFKYARADYFEVLMTQRDALEAKLDLVDTKREQLVATVTMFRNLGGGWK